MTSQRSLPSWGSSRCFEASSSSRIARHVTYQRQGTSRNLLASATQSSEAVKAPETKQWNEHSVLDFLKELTNSPTLSHRSLLLFTLESTTRKLAISITHSREFPTLITLLIVGNCVFLLLFDPLLDTDSQWNRMVSVHCA